MPLVQRPTLSRTLLQMQLARFYDKPVARVSAGLILSILCVTFFAFAAIRPTLQTMADLIKQIEEKREVDSKLTLKINALSIAQKELSTKEERVNKAVSIAVPSTPDFSALLVIFEKLASENGVLFLTLNTSEVPPERTPLTASGVPTNLTPVLESIPFTLSMEGTYDKLSTTLQNIQNLQRIIVVDQFDINVSPQDENDTLILQVTGRAFSLNNEKKGASATKAL